MDSMNGRAGGILHVLPAVALVAMLLCALVAIPSSDADVQALDLPPVDDDGVITISVDGTYSLDRDITSSILIDTGAVVSIDLNGHKITNTENMNTITVDGTFTLTDSAGNGIVDNISPGMAALVIDPTGTVTINGGTLERSAETGTLESGGDNSFYTVLNHGTLTVNNGTILNAGGFSSVIANGWYNPDENTTQVDSVLTITGGTISGGKYVKNDDYGVMTIDGGTFSGASDVAILNWNELTINSGSFSSTTNSVICLRGSSTIPYELGQLTINGGTFVPANGEPVVNISSTGVSGITVDSGVFSKGTLVASIETGTTDTLPITFGSDSITLEKIVIGESGMDLSIGSVAISGDVTESTDGSITVKSGTARLIGNVNLGTGAITVESGAKLVIPADTTYTGKLTIQKNANVDVAGTITVPEGSTDAITNDGTVSITSSSAVIPFDQIQGSGSFDTSAVSTDGTIGGDWNTTTQYSEYQTVTLNSDTRLMSGTTLVIYGTMVVPADTTLLIEDGAKLAMMNTTANLLIEGTVTVMSADSTGALVAMNGAHIVNNGILQLGYSPANGTAADPSNHVVVLAGEFINNDTVLVGASSDIVNSSSMTNNGVFTVEGTLTGDMTNNGIVNIDGIATSTIDITSTDAVVNIESLSGSLTVDLSGYSDKTTVDDATTIVISPATDCSVKGILITTELINGQTEGTYVLEASIAGSMTVVKDQTDATIGASVSTSGNIIVPGSLVVGKDVTVSLSGYTTITGIMTAVDGATVNMSSTGNTLDVPGELTLVDGTTITASGNTIKAAMYRTDDGDIVYTTLENAVVAGTSITVLGPISVSDDLLIPEDVTVSVVSGATLTIPANVNVTIADGAVLSNAGTVDVDGILYAETARTALRSPGTITSDVTINGTDDRIYTNLPYALSNSLPGDVIKLSDTITIGSSIVIPEDVTLDTNGMAVNVADKVAVTVNGALFIDNGPSVSSITLGNGSRIVLNGIISSDETIPADLVPGAYFSITERANQTYYVAPVTDAASIIDRVDDSTITIRGIVSINELSFTGTDDEPAVVNITGKVTANSIVLSDASIVLSTTDAFNGTIADTNGSVSLTKVIVSTGTAIADIDGDLTVTGSITSGTINISSNVTAKGLDATEMIVGGNLTITEDSNITDLIVNGTLEVTDDATLTSTGSVEVLGTLTVTSGDVDVTTLFVGVTSGEALTGVSAVVSGDVSVANYAMVTAGSSVPESIVNDPTLRAVVFEIDGAEFMTVYAASGALDFDDIDAHIVNAFFDGWYSGTTEATGDIHDSSITTVDAKVTTDVYDIILVASDGIVDVSIDGNLMVYGVVNGSYAYTATVDQGEHTITYGLKNGWHGDATLYVNGTAQDGMTFSTNGTPTADSSGKMVPIVYHMQLSGVTTAEIDSGKVIALTDVLLIVLICLIVIMAIMVALKMSRD